MAKTKKKTAKEAKPVTPVEAAEAKAKADEKAGISRDVRLEAEKIMADLAASERTQYAPNFQFTTVGQRERVKAACRLLCDEERLRTRTTGRVWDVMTDGDRAEREAYRQRQIDIAAAFKRLEGIMGDIVFENGHYAESPHEGAVDPVALLDWIEVNAKPSAGGK